MVTLHAIRREGFEGAIRVELKNPPPGVKFTGIIPAGAERVAATIFVSKDARPGVVVPDLVARVKRKNGEIRRGVLGAEDRMQAFLYRHLLPCEEISWVVEERPSAGILKVKLPPDSTRLKVSAGMVVTVPVTLQRAPGFSGAFKIVMIDPPEGISLIRGGVGGNKKALGALKLEVDPEKAPVGLTGALAFRAETIETLFPEGVDRKLWEAWRKMLRDKKDAANGEKVPEVKLDEKQAKLFATLIPWRRKVTVTLPAVAFEVVEPKPFAKKNPRKKPAPRKK